MRFCQVQFRLEYTGALRGDGEGVKSEEEERGGGKDISEKREGDRGR